MRFSDLLRTAFLNLWRRKLRAVLTVLGMVIGVCSIVVMVSLGIGMKEAMIESYAQMGSLNNITVMNWHQSEGMDFQEVVLDKKAVRAISQIPGVTAVMPRINTWGILKSGKYISDVSIMAIDAQQAELFGIELMEGDYPSGKSGGTTYEMVIPISILQNFYEPNTGKQAIDRDGNPIINTDSRFQITFDYSNVYDYQIDEGENGTTTRGRWYRISPSGFMADDGGEFSWCCLMDLKAFEKLAKENKDFISVDMKKYSEVLVKCADTETVASVRQAINEMGYSTSSLQEWIEQSEQELATVQYLLGAIGSVSLLVAAIGIMNTMMMSIYERTKEIGIIKVLGCPMKNITELFLTEAAYIGFFGGAIGLIASYGISIVLNGFLSESGLRSLIPPYLAVGAVAFAIIVALASGIYPAIRAMKLSPLAAIRNE